MQSCKNFFFNVHVFVLETSIVVCLNETSLLSCSHGHFLNILEASQGWYNGCPGHTTSKNETMSITDEVKFQCEQLQQLQQ